MRRYMVLISILGALTLSACGSSETASGGPEEGKVTIVTTTTQLTDFATIIGGEHASVYGVLKANVDPHDYEPSPADVSQIAGADLLVKNGVDFEEWFEATIKSADPKGEIVDASSGVALRAGAEHEGEGAEHEGEGDEHEGEAHEEGDPHIWQDPHNAKIMVSNITRALEKVDPANASDYQRNQADYLSQIDVLDAEVKAEIDGLANKKLVTNHDAFGYYIDRYGLEFVGSIIPGFDTQAELSVQDISDIVAKIRSAGVKAVFSESSLPPKTAEAIGKEAGVKVVAGENALYGDTLGPEGSAGDTYLKMIRHNTRVIVDNLA